MKRFLLSMFMAIALATALVSVPLVTKAEYANDEAGMCAAWSGGDARCHAPATNNGYCDAHQGWAATSEGWWWILTHIVT